MRNKSISKERNKVRRMASIKKGGHNI